MSIGVLTQDPVRRVLDRLEAVKPTGTGKYTARCPAHDDGHASLSIGIGDDGRALLHCHAGCATADVLAQIGLTERDLFADGNGNKAQTTATMPASKPKATGPTFPTLDAAIQTMARIIGGTFVWKRQYPGPHDFHIARFDLAEIDTVTGKCKKEFRPFHNNGKGFVCADPPGLLPLYRGDDLPADAPIIVTEGELKADAVRELRLYVVTSSHGSQSASKTDWTPLAHRDIIILADNDAPGMKYALEVAAILTGQGCKVRIVNLPGLPAKGDIVDWISPDGPMGGKDDDEIKAAILALADAASVWTPPEAGPDAQAEPELVLPDPLCVADLLAQYPELRPPVIDGLIRRGEVANLISSPKLYKSWFTMHVALCVATGRSVFGFPTTQGRVLMLDYELAPGTLAKRFAFVCDAMNIRAGDISDNLVVQPLRGRRLDVTSLGRYLHNIAPSQFALVCIDPMYKLLPADADENSNVQMANLYGDLQRYAERLDAAFIVVHHLTKGNQSDRSVTDLGAGGGSQSRAADTHLAIRPHSEEGAAVLAGVVRSFPPFEPVAMRWHFPLWERADDLDPTDLKRPPRKTSKPKEPVPVEPAKPSYDVPGFVAAFLTTDPKPRTAILADAQEKGLLAERRAENLLKSAEGQGKAHRWKVGKTNLAYFANCPQPKLIVETEAAK